MKKWRECGKDRDDLSWLLCTNRQPHEQEKLMLTQIIAGDALMTLAKLSHETRAMWDIAMFCGCPMAANAKPSNGICKEILRNLKREKQKKTEQINGRFKRELQQQCNEDRTDESDSPLNWLADVALSDQNKSSTVPISASAPALPLTPVLLPSATTGSAASATTSADDVSAAFRECIFLNDLIFRILYTLYKTINRSHVLLGW